MTVILQNPDHMSSEEVFSEISSLQTEIRVRGVRLHHLARSLYQRARRAPSDDSTAIYITYANTVTKFAGAVEQILRRNDRTARILKLLPEKVIERPAPLEKQEKAPLVEAGSPMESLIQGYIEEALTETSSDSDDG